MNFVKNMIAKLSATPSPAAKSAKKSRRQSTARAALPTFEPLEGRQMMSASTISAVSYVQLETTQIHIGAITIPIPQVVPTTAVFSVGPSGQVFESTGPGNSTDLGGNVTQISAGLDAAGGPEVYGLAPNGSLMANDNGAGWKSLGGYSTQISASIHGTVYAVGTNNVVWVNNASGWACLNMAAAQISAGVTSAGQPEVYAVGQSTPNVSVNSGGNWVSLGSQFNTISGTMNDTVYAIGTNGAVFVDHSTSTGGTGWTSLGGQAAQIAAGVDASGSPEVFAVSPGSRGVVSVNDGKYWVPVFGTPTQIAAPAIGVAPSGLAAALSTSGQTFMIGTSGSTALPLPFTTEPAGTNAASWTNVSSNPLFGPNGPSVDDVKQGGTSDCYFLAALSNVAYRDPALIRSDITQRSDGTYDVYFHKGTAIVDEHVDGWLPVNSSGTPVNAKLGQGGGTWVAIMEKAFCYFRNSAIAPSYANINFGWATEALPDLGATNVQNLLPSITTAGELWSDVLAAISKHEAVQFGTGSNAGPLVSGHEYSVLYVVIHPTEIDIVVRNPWGTDGPNSDGHIWVDAAAVLPESTKWR